MPNLYTTLQDFIGQLEETEQPPQYISPLELMLSASQETTPQTANNSVPEPTPQALPLAPAVIPKTTTQVSLKSFIPAQINEKVKQVVNNYIPKTPNISSGKKSTFNFAQAIKNLPSQIIDPLKNSVFTDFLGQVNQAVYPYKIRVIEGFRSPQRQAQLYQQGRTTKGNVVTYARPGQSAHNSGLAIDIGFVSPSGKSILPSLADALGLYNTAGKIGKNSGLIWGGNFKGLVDKPHFELSKR